MAYWRIPELMLRFEVRPRALWTNPEPPSALYRAINLYSCRIQSIIRN